MASKTDQNIVQLEEEMLDHMRKILFPLSYEKADKIETLMHSYNDMTESNEYAKNHMESCFFNICDDEICLGVIEVIKDSKILTDELLEKKAKRSNIEAELQSIRINGSCDNIQKFVYEQWKVVNEQIISINKKLQRNKRVSDLRTSLLNKVQSEKCDNYISAWIDYESSNKNLVSLGQEIVNEVAFDINYSYDMQTAPIILETTKGEITKFFKSSEKYAEAVVQTDKTM